MKKETFLGLVALISIFFAMRSLMAVDCEKCCKEGRFVSRECCEQCGGCDMYSDEGAAECRDYPT